MRSRSAVKLSSSGSRCTSRKSSSVSGMVTALGGTGRAVEAVAVELVLDGAGRLPAPIGPLRARHLDDAAQPKLVVEAVDREVVDRLPRRST